MYPVALLLFVVLLLQKARSLQSKREGPGPEAADSPKKGREPHNDRPMRRASGHQARGVYASCGKTYSSAGSFPQSTMENSTTFIYQQRQEFHRLFHLVLQAFPITFSSRCKASCLCCLCYSDLFLVSHSASLLGHSLFRRVLYASVFFILKLDTWFPSFFFPSSSCHLTPFILTGHLPRKPSWIYQTWTARRWPHDICIFIQHLADARIPLVTYTLRFPCNNSSYYLFRACLNARHYSKRFRFIVPHWFSKQPSEGRFIISPIL